MAANSKDWRQWAFKTETILKQKELWYVIENAAPATNNTDEANTTDAALWAHQYQTTEMRKCRYG